MPRKDDDFLLVEEENNRGKYIVICALIAIVGFGGYSFMNLNKIVPQNQPESPIATDNYEGNQEEPQTETTTPNEIINGAGKSAKTTINFAYDSSVISESEKKRLQEFVGKVKEGKGEIKVEGYADGKGITEYNNTLSVARANGAADILKELGLADKITVSAQGLGMDKPIANNDSEEGRAKNRRVEIMFIPTK